jgi:phosphatidylglycerol---prolipoprotein diacylglyceryl transferase
VGLHPDLLHLLFESLAYAAGFALYRRERRRAGDFLSEPDRNWVIVAAVLGAATGSTILAGFHGKTVVGGLLGGTIAVEWTKRRLSVTRRTGDLFAIPIAAAMAVGRIGCYLDGLADRTYGVATTLPWGVDFGDGVRRHPAQLYEMAFLLVAVAALRAISRRPRREGLLFRAFLVGYLAFRLAVDFLKPDPRFLGLSAIQWACAAALCWYARDRSWLTASGHPSTP